MAAQPHSLRPLSQLLGQDCVAYLAGSITLGQSDSLHGTSIADPSSAFSSEIDSLFPDQNRRSPETNVLFRFIPAYSLDWLFIRETPEGRFYSLRIGFDRARPTTWRGAS